MPARGRRTSRASVHPVDDRDMEGHSHVPPASGPPGRLGPGGLPVAHVSPSALAQASVGPVPSGTVSPSALAHAPSIDGISLRYTFCTGIVPSALAGWHPGSAALVSPVARSPQLRREEGAGSTGACGSEDDRGDAGSWSHSPAVLLGEGSLRGEDASPVSAPGGTASDAATATATATTATGTATAAVGVPLVVFARAHAVLLHPVGAGAVDAVPEDRESGRGGDG